MGRSIKRTLEMWDSLLSYFSSHPDVDKAGKVKTIATILNKSSTKVYLLFLSDMMEIFDKLKVNMSLQSSTTAKINTIHGTMTHLLHHILSFSCSQE